MRLKLSNMSHILKMSHSHSQGQKISNQMQVVIDRFSSSLRISMIHLNKNESCKSFAYLANFRLVFKPCSIPGSRI